MKWIYHYLPKKTCVKVWICSNWLVVGSFEYISETLNFIRLW